MSKSRKRSLSKGKHGGLAAKAPREERNPAAKTVKDQKPFFHFVPEFFLLLWKFFLLLWKRGQELFSCGPREKKKETSLSFERPDAASPSSALAIPSGVSVAAKRASEEQTEGPAVEKNFVGTVNDKDPSHDPNSTGNSNETLTLVPEDIEAVISSNRVTVGGIIRVDRVGYQKKEEAKVNLLQRLHMIEEDEIKSERPGSNSGDWKKRLYDDLKKERDDLKNERDDLKEERDDLKEERDDLKKERDGLKKERDDLKKERDDLKKERGDFDKSVEVRQVFSDFGMTRSAKIMDDGIKKEVLKLPAVKSEKIDKIIGKASFTRILLQMFFQRANMPLKSSFCYSHWRSHYRFPNFSNDSADYKWWEKNFVPKILEKRLALLQEAAKNWNPKLEIFMIIQLVSDLNSRLHRHPSENEFNEKDEVKMFKYEGIDLQTTISYLRSGDENLELEESSIEYDAGDSKI